METQEQAKEILYEIGDRAALSVFVLLPVYLFVLVRSLPIFQK